MSAPPSPAKLRNYLDKWLSGRYALYPGWETRTRPYPIDVNGLIQHHTGGPFTDSASYLKFLFVDGRPGIPGPLCNFATDYKGIVHVGSRLRTNNAGAGYFATLNHVIREDYAGFAGELHPGADDFNDGNGHYWGNEIMYPGTVPPKPKQYRSAVLLAAMCFDMFGWSPLSQIAHREHSSRKWDPGQVDLAKMRRDVRDALNTGPSWESDMTADELIVLFQEAAARSTPRGRNLSTAVHQIMRGTRARPDWLASVLFDADIIKAPPSAPDAATNPNWTAERHLTDQSQAAIFTIPELLKGLPDAIAEKIGGSADAALIKQVITEVVNGELGFLKPGV